MFMFQARACRGEWAVVYSIRIRCQAREVWRVRSGQPQRLWGIQPSAGRVWVSKTREVSDAPRNGPVAGYGKFRAGEEGLELAEEGCARLRSEQGNKAAEEGDTRRGVGVGQMVQPPNGGHASIRPIC
jgi:hypothetical protein